MIEPQALKPGDTIGFVCPSSPMRVERLPLGVRFLENKGFKVKFGKHVKDSTRFLAGRDEDRAQDIMDFFKDQEVKAIMATAGGYGSQRLLPYLDFEYIKNNPKWVSGFSDTTALNLALLTKSGLISATGFTLRDLEQNGPDPLIDSTLMHCFNNQSFSVKEGQTGKAGKANGRLIGGTLSLLTALMGTPYQPDFQNAVLIIEEVFAEPFQVDCMLSQLELAGVFDTVSAVIFGQFVFCDAKEDPDQDGTIDDVVQEWMHRIPCPSLVNFPYGHGNRRCVLPLGKNVEMDTKSCEVCI